MSCTPGTHKSNNTPNLLAYWPLDHPETYQILFENRQFSKKAAIQMVDLSEVL